MTLFLLFEFPSNIILEAGIQKCSFKTFYESFALFPVKNFDQVLSLEVIGCRSNPNVFI